MRTRTTLTAILTVLALVAAVNGPAQTEARFRMVAERLLPARAVLAHPAANAPGHYVIQLSGVADDAVRAKLAKAGAMLFDYVPDNAYLAWLPRNAYATVTRVPGVRWVSPYDPVLRIDPDLAVCVSVPTRTNPVLSGETITVGIELFPDTDRDALPRYLTGWGGAVLSDDAVPNGRLVRATIPAALVSRLVEMEGVKWVDRSETPVLANNVARILCGADAAGLRYAPTRYLYGTGETIAVLDTGLDTGDEATVHQDIRGRIVAAHAWAGENWQDNNGHGTHVVGSALGNGTLSGSNAGAHTYAGSYAGMAPEAGLSLNGVASDSGALTGLYNLSFILPQAYLDGARICSNSWGSATQGRYDSYARLIDSYAISHPDFLMVFAAGNSGVDVDRNGVIDPGSICSPAVAKNVLAVGASENNETGRLAGARLDMSYAAFGYTWPPFLTDSIANNPSGVAAFSSRGPTSDGRVKPEIVAPGTSIVSMRSSVVTASYQKIVSTPYAIDDGTSMATPLVAGAAAVLRQYLRQGLSVATPTSALLKACLMASARDLAPGQYGNGAYREVMPAPNNTEGFGRLDIAAATSPALRVLTADTTVANAAAQEFTISVPGGKPEMRAVLCWTDPLAASTAATQLVNDLDLEVTAPNGTKILSRSRVNNFETVYVASPAPGVWKFRVVGTHIPLGPQHFSLVLFWRY